MSRRRGISSAKKAVDVRWRPEQQHQGMEILADAADLLQIPALDNLILPRVRWRLVIRVNQQ
jgi:hypothetical protein